MGGIGGGEGAKPRRVIGIKKGREREEARREENSQEGNMMGRQIGRKRGKDVEWNGGWW